MPRTCSVCSHDDRQEIEVSLISGRSLRDIAGHFGLSKTALDRHRHDHLHAGTRAISAQDAEQRSQVLLAEADALLGKATTLLLSAEESGDTKTALIGVKEARGCIELLSKLQSTVSLDSSSVIDVSRSDESVGLDHGTWTMVCELLSNVLQRWPTLANTIAGGLRDAGLADAAEIVVNGIPETLRIDRSGASMVNRRPSRSSNPRDMEFLRAVLVEELRTHPELQQRIVARLKVIESDVLDNTP